jgi:ElaB/YqjD/DUF883 family membrane-anchored ribosome-binding protein
LPAVLQPRQPLIWENIMSESTEGSNGGAWERVQDEAQTRVEDAAARARGRLAEAAGSLEATYRQASEDTARLMREAKDQATQRYAELEARIKEQPIVGVGLGVLIGLVLAITLSSGPRTVVIRERRHL